jgi:hypothetical protein
MVTATTTPDTAGLEQLLDFDPDAWSPRPAVFRQASTAIPSSARQLTAPELYGILRARGFRETKRRGILGFVGIRVSPEHLDAPALVPEHSASSYRNRGDRSPEARRALRHDRTARAILKDPTATPRSGDRFTRAPESPGDLHRRALVSEAAELNRQAGVLDNSISSGPTPPPSDPRLRQLAALRARQSEILDQLAG